MAKQKYSDLYWEGMKLKKAYEQADSKLLKKFFGSAYKKKMKQAGKLYKSGED